MVDGSDGWWIAVMAGDISFLSLFYHAVYAAGVRISVLLSLSIEMKQSDIWDGSSSLIHASLISVLEVKSYALCPSHDGMYTSVSVSCAVSRTVREWRRAAEQPRPDLQCQASLSILCVCPRQKLILLRMSLSQSSSGSPAGIVVVGRQLLGFPSLYSILGRAISISIVWVLLLLTTGCKTPVIVVKTLHIYEHLQYLLQNNVSTVSLLSLQPCLQIYCSLNFYHCMQSLSFFMMSAFPLCAFSFC